ncbi:MAG: hypothetical protein M3535_09110 [Actinomycetota bacterium]|nr:hypothetical protein [Actinomycetota bacterium]
MPWGWGGLAAFPLDELWHRAFGIDVTLWSPTHLMLVGAGSRAPAAWPPSPCGSC